VAGLTVALLQLIGGAVAGLWPWIGGIGVLCALPVTASVVQARSPGALDDASGVGTVLMVAQSLPAHVPLGVVLTSAEELGLAGARAWVKGRAPAQAINVDGVDDSGGLRLTWTRRRPTALIERLRNAASKAGTPVRAGPLFPGVLLDGVALADVGWDVVTVSRGTLRTVARIHLPDDSLANLEGDGMARATAIISEAITSNA
jgi:Zn-dependent M28 family amino/carboxypeptidase